MIKKLAVTNFRGIKKGEIDLFPITILLGPNNSAKSTILEAIFLAPNPCREVPYLIPLGKDSRTLRQEDSSRALDVVYYLHQSLDYRGYGFLLHNYTVENAEVVCVTGKGEIELSLESDKTARELRFTGALKSPQKDETDIIDTIRRGDAAMEAYRLRVPLNELGLYDTTNRKPVIDESLLISPKLLRVGYSYLRNQWYRIVNSGISRKIAVETSKFSKEIYQDFTMEPVMGGHLDFNAYLADGRRIRLADLGEGVQSYAMSRILYELANPKILLWDDLESHFNPRILGYLADWFNDLVNDGRQIILSTHSLEATKIIAGVSEEQTQIYVTSLDESILKTKSLTLDKLEQLQKAGIDARVAEDFLL